MGTPTWICHLPASKEDSERISALRGKKEVGFLGRKYNQERRKASFKINNSRGVTKPTNQEVMQSDQRKSTT